MCCNSWWVGWGWKIIYIWLDWLSLLLDIIGDSFPDMLHCLFGKCSWRPAILLRNLVQLAPDQSFCSNKFSASQIRDVFLRSKNLGNRSVSNHVVSHRRRSQKLSQMSWIFNDSAPRTDAKAGNLPQMDVHPAIEIDVLGSATNQSSSWGSWWFDVICREWAWWSHGMGDSCRSRSGVDALDWTSWLGQKWPPSSWYTGHTSDI